MIAPKTIISIDGEFLFNFEKVTLSQTINDHHSFEVIIDYDAIETLGGHTLDKSKKWLGSSIVINFNDREFLGVITDIRVKHGHGYNGKLSITGYSKTILLEGGKHLKSWINKNLTNIVKDTIKTVAVDAVVAPVYSGIIEYQSQYEESHFTFLKRLAKQYHEWFYYDGIQLIFGKPTLDRPIEIEYGMDMEEIDIAISAKPNQYQYFSYNATNDTANQGATTNIISGQNELGAYAFEASRDIFTTSSNERTSARVNDKSEIDILLKNKQASQSADSNVLSGKSTKQGLSIGSVIKVNSARYTNRNFDVKGYGEYIITEITHTATGVSEYENRFKAIPSGIEVLPEPIVSLPVATSQIGYVLSNEDPKQIGRVQVRFLWQTDEMRTSWIRVMTPDAGSSQYHSQNRGSVFIPEVGDQVMIGFRYNDPNRPFIMGSLFNGSTGAGGKLKNNYKSIITKGGHIIEFNDTNNSESITITDKKGNNLIIDTAGETITINALKDIKISAGENINISAGKNIAISAGENLDTSASKNTSIVAGNDMMLNAAGNLTETTDNRKDLIEEEFIRQSATADEIAEEISVFSMKENMTLQSAKTVEINSAEKSKLF